MPADEMFSDAALKSLMMSNQLCVDHWYAWVRKVAWAIRGSHQQRILWENEWVHVMRKAHGDWHWPQPLMAEYPHLMQYTLLGNTCSRVFEWQKLSKYIGYCIHMIVACFNYTFIFLQNILEIEKLTMTTSSASCPSIIVVISAHQCFTHPVMW